MNIEIILALPDQEPVLSNLLELYEHDYSEFINTELGADGRFGYEYLSLYWKRPNYYPFLIQVNGHLAGFILFRKGSQISASEDIWDMTEFFIVRGYRRRGVGMKAAHEVWKQYPGKWEVRVMDRTPPSKAFWGRAIEEFLSKTINPIPFKYNDEGWHFFSFNSKHL